MGMKLEGDYLIDNLLWRVERLTTRVGALERRGRGKQGTTEPPPSGAAPDDDLPDADDIMPLYLIERTTGELYQLICEIRGGRAKLFLQRVGPLREEG